MISSVGMAVWSSDVETTDEGVLPRADRMGIESFHTIREYTLCTVDDHT